MAIYGSLGDIDVGAIDKSIADTATDIFVYDTRKDSDGGAWRKRTQHTSWYNETLNTATRGARREFPAVAVIVAETSKVTIYDGDDPDMPMWMVFNTTDGSMLRSGQIISISMLNAELWVGHASGSALHWINFLKDTARWLTGSSSYGGYYGQVPNSGGTTILDRNTSGGNYYNNIGGASDITIAGSSINDVAMTVIPNAPIDPSTGLPVPTIAVATDGGVSVIKDDGTIANINPGASSVVTFDKNNGLWINFNSGGSGIGWYYYTNFTSTSSLSSIYHNNSGWSSNWDMLGGVYYRGLSYGYSSLTTGTLGLSNFDGFGAIKATTTMSNFITTSYNTGWMHGDIKGAWLSDTSTASVTGTELVTNGDFATSTLTSYTQLYNCSLSVVSNQLRVTSTAASGYCEFYIGISDTTKYHYLSFQFVGASGITQFGIYAGSTGYITDTNAGWSNSSYGASRSAGTYTLLIPPGNSIVGFVFGIASLGQTWTFDNISLRKVTELDRSVNNRGLAVYGTIAKTPVATNSNLVAYSGFSVSNYLQQPYNSALDFGTGNYSIIFWINSPSIAVDQSIFTLGDYSQVNSLQLLVLNSSGNGNNLSYSEVGSPASFLFGPHEGSGWIQIAIVRNGTTVSAYINGILNATVSNANPTNINLSSATHKNLVIGAGSHSGTVNYPYSGSVSLFRMSASAPSSEQIKKIYEDEKVLFQENAKCTLYGSSDAVTALAYDDYNQLLHVGTSSGRSDFQGLRRINNTTTAVTTAISASNGLIAEQ